MAKARSRILQAQERYLRTKDPKDVEDLYIQLVRLGRHLVTRRGNDYQDADVVLDIAADIVMNLMEKGEPVIRSAPSAYLCSALFYKRKVKPGPDSIDGMDIPTTDGKDGAEYWRYADDLLDSIDNDESSEVGALIGQTLESKMPWRKVCRELPDLEIRREYKNRMKELEGCVRKSVRHRAVAD